MTNADKLLILAIFAFIILLMVASYTAVKQAAIAKCSVYSETPSIELELKKLELKKLQYEIKIINEQEELENE